MDLVSKIDSKLKNGLLPARALISRLRVINEGVRHSGAYTDPTNFPAYYHLGRELSPKALITFGFDDGIASSCFLLGCKTVERFLAFRQATDTFYSPRLGQSNIKDCFQGHLDVHVGESHDEVFLDKVQSQRWGVAIVRETTSYDVYMSRLRLMWDHLDANGLIIMDGINYDRSAGQAYRDFCKVSNRNEVVCNSKYGLGLIHK